MQEFFQYVLPELTRPQWVVYGLIFIVNLMLFLFAKPIVRMMDNGEDSTSKLKVFQSLNIFVFLLLLADLVLLKFSGSYQNYFVKVGMSLAVGYAALFVQSLLGVSAKKRFGNARVQDEKTIYMETYNSRLIELVFLVVVSLTAVYILIKIWGADSLLETTGIFGILIAFAAFTSNVWAPDIVSGLIILNTQMLEDGDVVVIEGYPDEYIINKVTLIYLILYDVRNNHRTLIRNSQFTQRKIDNLSRVASTDGVRRHLVYKVAYPVLDRTENNVDEQLQSFKNRVDRVFRSANEKCSEIKELKINLNRDFEWAMTSAGDYALEYTLWIYLERIPNTRVTAKIRNHLLQTRYQVNEQVFFAAEREGISLSTPVLANIEERKTIAGPA